MSQARSWLEGVPEPLEAVSARELKLLNHGTQKWRAFALSLPQVSDARKLVEEVWHYAHRTGLTQESQPDHPLFQNDGEYFKESGTAWDVKKQGDLGFAKDILELRKEERKRKGQPDPTSTKDIRKERTEACKALIEVLSLHKDAVNNLIKDNEKKKWQDKIHTAMLPAVAGKRLIATLKSIVQSSDGKYHHSVLVAKLGLLASVTRHVVSGRPSHSGFADWTLFALWIAVVFSSARQALFVDGDILASIRTELSDGAARGRVLLYTSIWLVAALACGEWRSLILSSSKDQSWGFTSLGSTFLRRATEFAGLFDMVLEAVVHVAELAWCTTGLPLVEAVVGILYHITLELRSVLHETLARTFAHAPTAVFGLGLPLLNNETIIRRQEQAVPRAGGVLVEALFWCTFGLCKQPAPDTQSIEQPISTHDRIAIFKACDTITLGVLPNVFGHDGSKTFEEERDCIDILSNRAAASADAMLSTLVALAVLSVLWRLSRSWTALYSAGGALYTKAIGLCNKHPHAAAGSAVVVVGATLTIERSIATALSNEAMVRPGVLWLLGAMLPLLTANAILGFVTKKEQEKLGSATSWRKWLTTPRIIGKWLIVTLILVLIGWSAGAGNAIAGGGGGHDEV